MDAGQADRGATGGATPPGGEPPGATVGDPARGILRAVLGDAASFDPAALAPVAGLRAAAGLLAVLAVGLTLWGPGPAVIVASGALSSGIASVTGGVRPPLPTMVASGIGMAISTFVGSATGDFAWLHLGLLGLWGLAGGLLVGLGSQGALVGVQSIVGFIVYGRFADTPGGAMRLAGLVLGGVAAQTLLAAAVRWPPTLLVQRRAIADGYRRLAELAAGSPESSGIPSAERIDAAERALSSRGFIGRADVGALHNLVAEARRIRLELVALHGLSGQAERGVMAVAAALPPIEGVLHEGAGVLAAIAGALGGRGGDDGDLDDAVGRLDAAVARVSTTVPDPVSAPAGGDVARVAEALAGQLRAAAGLAAEAAELRVRPGIHRPGSIPRLGGWARGVAALQELRDDLTLESAPGRHALRLAVVLVTGALVAEHSPLQRGYWVALTTAVVLKPDFGATFARGAARVGGTVLGVLIAGVVTATLHPTDWVALGLIAALGWATFSLLQASYTVAMAFLTAIVVLLLGLVSPDTAGTAADRLVDTVVGGAISLVVYALWPTWSRGAARSALATLSESLRHYLGAVLEGVPGAGSSGPDIAALARAARLARSEAASAVARSLAEPARVRIDAVEAAGVLAGLRRVAVATHVLRTHRPVDGAVPGAEAAGLAGGIDAALADIALALDTGVAPSHPAPPLRRLHGDLVRAVSDRPEAAILVIETDEIVDAVDTLAHLLHLGQKVSGG